MNYNEDTEDSITELYDICDTQNDILETLISRLKDLEERVKLLEEK